ncbi:MAG: transferrin-binding protein-like solute binding protein [Neisseriaceae bacterium]|nr:transferrin-binding protein-like solute binding protein [Neisseriaceae bacterium]
MKIKFIFLQILSLCVLTACGGSDDGGSVQPVNNPSSNFQTNSQSTQNQNSKNQNTNTTSSNSQNQVVIHTFDAATNKVTSTSKMGNDGDNYTKLIVDSKTVATLPDSIISGASDSIDMVLMKGAPDSVDGANSNYVLAYARFGAIVDKKEMKATMFYQGSPTPSADMPTDGKAVYWGTAAAIDTNEFKRAYTGFSQFTADFSAKKLNGLLSLAGQSLAGGNDITYEEVNIDAVINANTFNGKANGQGSVNGKFYGQQAQNLAGMFVEPNKKLHGVFGANKQK